MFCWLLTYKDANQNIYIYIYKETERETERDREREKAWQPTPIFLPRKSHEENPQRRLVGYNT